MYQRKTKDVFELQGNYGCGWECILEEDSIKEAEKQLLYYEKNEFQYPHRIKKRRVKLEICRKEYSVQ